MCSITDFIVHCQSSCYLKWNIYILSETLSDRLSGLVVRVPGYRTEMQCVFCEVRTEFIYVMKKKVDRLYGLVVRVPGYRSRGPGSIPGATRFSEKNWASNGAHSSW
jgi:hypothetical protein